jgi:ABC-2 type transport system ATP-binding protein
MQSVIEIENLTKDYEVGFWRKKKIRALDDLSLTVERSEIFGFLGANGAGKTTTIKLLMRLIYPTSGSARILGRDIADVRMHAAIGYLPERPYFYDYLTARELLEYCAALFGFTRADQKTRAARMLARVGLDEASWDKQLRKFSKGMLQRVGLAQALINDPEVVFLDEPMSGLDPVGRREVRDLIANLRDEGVTVFLCTHILSDIEVLCDRAAIMQKGKLAHLGTIEELRAIGAKISDAAENKALEIILAEVDGAELEKSLQDVFGREAAPQVICTPGGARVEAANEKDVDAILAAARSAGARLVAVQTIGGALEKLFS